MTYCSYEIAIILRYIEGIADYRIGRTRVTRLCMCVCIMCVQYNNIVGCVMLQTILICLVNT